MRPIKITLLLFCMVSLFQAVAQNDCHDLIRRTKSLLKDFPVYPDNDGRRDAALSERQRDDPRLFRDIDKLIADIKSKSDRDPNLLQCFATQFNNVSPTAQDGNIISWYSYIAGKSAPQPFRSAEFRKGSGLHIDINQGVADVGKSSEAYSFSLRALYSYTVAPDGQEAGGRWRLMGGVSTYYQRSDFAFFGNARVEYRLKDIGNEQTSLGNIKFIADGNFGESVIAGGGLGLELSHFGFQLLYQRETKISSSHILTGLFYRFQSK